MTVSAPLNFRFLPNYFRFSQGTFKSDLPTSVIIKGSEPDNSPEINVNKLK